MQIRAGKWNESLNWEDVVWVKAAAAQEERLRDQRTQNAKLIALIAGRNCLWQPNQTNCLSYHSGNYGKIHNPAHFWPHINYWMASKYQNCCISSRRVIKSTFVTGQSWQRFVAWQLFTSSANSDKYQVCFLDEFFLELFILGFTQRLPFVTGGTVLWSEAGQLRFETNCRGSTSDPLPADKLIVGDTVWHWWQSFVKVSRTRKQREKSVRQ